MAKSRISCATPDCTNEILVIGQNRKLTDRKAAWLEDQGAICDECRHQQLIEADKKAAEQNAAAGLPELTGTEKQILWAEKIRADKLANIRKAQQGELPQIEIWAFYGDEGQPLPIDHEHFNHALETLKQQTGAAWWIDNRDIKAGVLFKRLYISNPPTQPATDTEQTVIDEIKAESTIRPEHPNTETVAEIQLHDSSISVHFPEKIESFRLLMRANGYTWSGSAWTRTINTFTGTAEDRAAEIGHKLLGAGFIIRVYNENARAKAVSGDYEPESKRWIKARISGEYKDWFAVEWSRDEDFYRQAKRLHRAQYSKPHVVVPAENFEEVQDFADIHNFRISTGAQALIDKAIAEREAALVVHVDPTEPVRKKRLSDRPAKLDVPELVEIDDSLKD
ncbi:MAG: hypothetical protein PHT48_09685 [Dechloromonas sp.]|nr:hypothetical protein [Dechloromonas sp.]